MSGTINPAKINDRETLLRRANKILKAHNLPEIRTEGDMSIVKSAALSMDGAMAPRDFPAWLDAVVARYYELQR